MTRLLKRLRRAVYWPLHPGSLRAAASAFHWRPEQAGAVTNGAVRRILVPQLHNSLGDLVLSMPFLEEVNRVWPGAVLDLIVGDAMTELFEGLPFVGRVLPFKPSRRGVPLARYEDTLRLAKLCKHLGKSYDVALDPRWDSDAFAYLARAGSYLSGAPLRVGYSGSVDGKDRSLDGFLTLAALGGQGEHELLRKLRLFERTGLSTRHIDDAVCLQTCSTLVTLAGRAAPTLKTLLEAGGLEPGEPYAVLAPSASAAWRIWPVERLVTMARELEHVFGLRFVIMGSAREVALCESVAAGISARAISIAGKTGIAQVCALLAGAALFVGNDSGPAHIAGLLGINTVTLSVFPASLNGRDHVNAPSRFSPCGPRVRVVQPIRPLEPCQQVCEQSTAHCIGQISAETVLTACRELLCSTEPVPVQYP